MFVSNVTFSLALFFILSFSLIVQSDFPVRERIFLLLDATQTSFGGASGKFPQYYNAYYDLVVGTDLCCRPLGYSYSLIWIHLIHRLWLGCILGRVRKK